MRPVVGHFQHNHAVLAEIIWGMGMGMGMGMGGGDGWGYLGWH